MAICYDYNFQCQQPRTMSYYISYTSVKDEDAILRRLRPDCPIIEDAHWTVEQGRQSVIIQGP